jgi:hypothetical protein
MVMDVDRGEQPEPETVLVVDVPTPRESRLDTTWTLEVTARLLSTSADGIRPSRARLFRLAPHAVVKFGDVDAAAGARHLGELAEEVLRDEVAASRTLREQWQLAPGADAMRLSDVDDKMLKAEALFAEAELDALRARRGSAMMNLKLATLSAPDVERFREVYDLVASMPPGAFEAEGL